VWLNNAVGAYNHAFFYAFLLSVIVLAAAIALSGWAALSDYWAASGLLLTQIHSSDGTVLPMDAMTAVRYSMGLGGASVLISSILAHAMLALAMLGFFLVVGMDVVRGTTTNERFRSSDLLDAFRAGEIAAADFVFEGRTHKPTESDILSLLRSRPYDNGFRNNARELLREARYVRRGPVIAAAHALRKQQ
jgi:hypothetical protein